MAGLLAGVDLGGTSIKAALADESGRVLARIADLIQRLHSNIANESPRAQLLGLGMGVPRLVDVQTGTTKFLPNLPTQWRGVPAVATLSERLGSPVRLLNDVRTATLGELRFGRDRPRVTLAFFSIGTGVGGGVAIDGQLRLGPLGAAGELGHQTLMADGPRCGCGNRGCLESLASGPAIVAEGVRLMRTGLASQLHQLVAGQCDRVTPRDMLIAADAGDELVREALQRAATWIGIAAANVVTVLLHPDLVVLGGGVAELGDLLTSTVQSVIHDRVGMFPTDAVQVVRSQLGDSTGLMGAITLAQTPVGQAFNRSEMFKIRLPMPTGRMPTLLLTQLPI